MFKKEYSAPFMLELAKFYSNLSNSMDFIILMITIWNIEITDTTFTKMPFYWLQFDTDLGNMKLVNK